MAQRNNIPSALYYFAKENGRLGSWHSGEMAYMYGNIPEDSRLYDESDRILSTTMQDYLYAFAKDGTLSFESMTRLSTKVETITDPNLALYEILDEMTGWGQ
jgi:para-nitrobenzyl esterase